MEERKYVISNKQMCCKRGFIRSEYIIALICFTYAIITMANCLKVITKFEYYDERVQDLIGITQLTRYINMASFTECKGSELSLMIDDDLMRVNVVNGNLIIQPGTQFVLANVSKASFNMENGLIYLKYVRGNSEYVMVVGHE